MTPLKLENYGIDKTHKVLFNPDKLGEIQYLRHKPNFLMRRIRPVIAVQHNTEIIYLKKKSAEAYIVQHQLIDIKIKNFTKKEIRSELTKIFQKSAE